MGKMKIAYILRGAFGEAGANASYMIPSIVNKTHDIMVLCPNRQRGNEKVVFTDDSVPITTLFHHGKQRLAEASLFIEKFQADIVHVFHQPDALLYPFIAKRLNRRKAKWICDIRSPLLATDPDLRRLIRRRALFLQPYLDYITTHETRSVSTVFPLRLKPVTCVPLGVNLREFPQPSTKGAIRKFIFTGTLSQLRKTDFLILAFDALLNKTNIPVTLDIYGAGNALEDLQRLVETLGRQNSIRLLGMVEQKKLLDLMLEYDAGISYVPYGHYSNAPPLKTLEYAAASLPILASDTESNRRFQQEGFQMSLFSNDFETFCRGALELIQNGHREEDISRNLKMVQPYDWNHIVQSRLLPLYQKLAG